MKSDLTKVKPSIGRVAVQLMKTETVSPTGLIVLPMGGGTITTVGEVIAVCDPYRGEHGEGPMYSIGDVVIFGKYTGSEISIGREKVVVMNEENILCTLHADEQQS